MTIIIFSDIDLIENIGTKQFIVGNSNFVLKNSAIIYLLDVLSTNLLDDGEYDQYMGETVMLINPVERYCVDKGRKEGMKEGRGRKEGMKMGKLDVAKNLLSEGFLIDEVVKLTGLSKEDILKD